MAAWAKDGEGREAGSEFFCFREREKEEREGEFFFLLRFSPSRLLFRFSGRVLFFLSFSLSLLSLSASTTWSFQQKTINSPPATFAPFVQLTKSSRGSEMERRRVTEEEEEEEAPLQRGLGDGDGRRRMAIEKP